MILDLKTLSANRVYHAMTQTLVPRPIAWVLSENGQRGFNLAPFSYFTGISSDPPLLMLSVGLKSDGSPKDTLVNIGERFDFVVHIPAMPQAHQVAASAMELPPEESEVSRLGLELTEFGDFRLPRLVGCPVAFACERHKVIEMGNTPQHLIFGRIDLIHVDDAVIETGDKGHFTVHAERMNPACRLGGETFAPLGAALRLPRPKP
ncbi:MAG: flavin reductase family protein [Magnetococcales bacterium]|nr:flavin reductase family protein [Magnetococcales bacterium]